MNNILIFGSLPSGFGGMEKSMSHFASQLNLDANYHVCFYFYDLNQNNNQDWLKNLETTIFKPKHSFRALQKYQTKKAFTHFLKKQTFSKIIAFDPLSVKLASDVIRAKKLNIELISWLHFSIESYKPKYQKYITYADKYFVLCDEMKTQLVNLLKLNPVSIYAIYNPLTKKEITIPKTSNYRFLYIGRVQYEGQKNLKELFLALAQLSVPFSLEVIGDKEDAEKTKLQELATSLKIDKSINWHSWQAKPWEFVQTYLKSISALVLTSTYEGFPMILIEALSYGVPCISSDCKTGPKDIINAQNGILYPVGDINALTEALHKINETTLSVEEVKNSISFCYDENYFKYIKSIL